MNDDRGSRAQEAARDYWKRLHESKPSSDELVAELAVKHRLTEAEVREAIEHTDFNFPP